MTRFALATAALLLSWMAASSAADTVRYTYKAFIGGTPAGEVTIDLAKRDDRYRVDGSAATTGFWRSIDDWSGSFSAEGALVDGAVVPERYVLLERSSRKEQHVVVTDGELFVTKNGKTRAPKPAHAGIDLLSGLWVVADCVDTADLHNGRHGFSVSRTRLDDGRCRYDVENDDGDTYSAKVRFAEHAGHRVLDELVVNRLIGTRIELTDVAVLTPAASQPSGQLQAIAASEAAPSATPASVLAPANASAADPVTDTAH